MNSGKRGTGGKHAEYVQRSGAYQNYKGGEELAFTESVNMPSWAQYDYSEFFRQADLNERANGSAYREFEFALPRELSLKQQIEFVREFVWQEIGANHPCTWAIHNPKASIENGDQPHCHMMFSERTLDGIERNPEQFFKRANTKHSELGGCTKSKKYSGGKLAAERKEAISAVRERFATLQNKHLAKHGHTVRVDHRSLKDQGIERQPEKHLGPVVAKDLNKKMDILLYRGIQQRFEDTAKDVAEIDIPACLASIHQAQAEAIQKEQENERIRENLRTADRANEDSHRFNQATRNFEGVASALGQELGLVDPQIALAIQRVAQAAPTQALTREEAKAALELAQNMLHGSSNDRLVAIREAKRALRAAAVAPVEPSSPSSPAEPLLQQSFLEKLAASWKSMIFWIKEIGPLVKRVDVNTEQGAYKGQVVEMDALHAIQKLGRTEFVIHRLDLLDKKPMMGDLDTGIEYRDGRGTVTSGPDRADELGKGR
jgi:hypothetical protein